MCLPVEKNVYKVERQWEHAGLLCAVTLAQKHGHRCGYVRVPPTHPLFGKSYNDDDVSLEVHGGITFAELEPCEHADGAGWWFGFDCHHCDDFGIDPTAPETELRHAQILMRRLESRMGAMMHAQYRTQDYVERECESLADQLSKLG